MPRFRALLPLRISNRRRTGAVCGGVEAATSMVDHHILTGGCACMRDVITSLEAFFGWRECDLNELNNLR